MTHQKTRRAAGAGFAALGVLGVLGAAGAWSQAQADAPQRATLPTDIVATTRNPTQLDPTGKQQTSVLTLALAQGRYVVSASASLVNFGASDYTRCQLALNGNPIVGSTGMVGDGSKGTNGDGALVMPFALNGAAVVGASGGTLSLRCSHDTSGLTPSVDPGATLAVHHSASLKRVTE